MRIEGAIDRFSRFAAQPSMKDLKDEIASTGSDFLNAFTAVPGGVLPNPDVILTMIAPEKLGDKRTMALSRDYYALYDHMCQTNLKFASQVETRKNGVLSKEMRVEPNKHDPDPERARVVADFVQAALDQIGDDYEELDDFQADLRHIMDAIPVGFSVAEIIWHKKLMRFGNGMREAWVPKCIKQRANRRFGFTVDGELRYQKSANEWVPVPPYRFLVYTHNPKNEDRYGRGKASGCFWAAFLSTQFTKWGGISAEKWGMPTALGLYPPGTKKEDQDKFLEIIRLIQSEYGAVIPKNLDVKLLEAMRSGSGPQYLEWIYYWDLMISEYLTGQSLATGQGTTGNGSYAAAKEHGTVKQEYVEADAKGLMGVINRQLVRGISGFNVGWDVPPPPWMIEYEAKDLSAEAKLDAKLLGMGLKLPAKYIYTKYKRPEPVEGEDVLERAATPTGFGFGEMPGDDDELEEGEELAARRGLTSGTHRTYRTHGKNGENAKDGNYGTGGFERMIFAVNKGVTGESERRASEREELLRKLVKRGAKVTEGIVDAVREEMERSSSLDELRARIEHLQSLSAGAFDLGNMITEGKVAMFLLSAAQVARFAREEAKREKRSARHGLNGRDGQDGRYGQEGSAGKRLALRALVDFEPVTPEEAIEWFADLVPMTKEMLEAVAAQARATAFTISGIESKDLLGKVKSLVSDYLLTGKTLQEWRKDFNGLMDDAGLTAKKPHEVERIYRTETSRAYTGGKLATLNDPDIKPAFPLRQYTAILDNRVQAEHAAMHGLILPTDHPFWFTHTPPLRPNCRCDDIALSRRMIEQIPGLYERWQRGELSTEVTLPDGRVIDAQGVPGNRGFGI